VKKPPNAFLLFCADRRPQLDVRGAAAQQVKLSTEWKTLTETAKKKWVDLSATHRAAHAKQPTVKPDASEETPQDEGTFRPFRISVSSESKLKTLANTVIGAVMQGFVNELKENGTVTVKNMGKFKLKADEGKILIEFTQKQAKRGGTVKSEE